MHELTPAYVRVWAAWDAFQPDPGGPIGAALVGISNTLGSPVTHEQWLTAQLQSIAADGRKAILCLWKAPAWANGTVGQDPGKYMLEDRKFASGTYKGLSLGVPTDLGPSGPWANWIQWLCDRYKAYGSTGSTKRLIEILEVVNEPNYQMWPQRNAAGDLTIACQAAQMVTTAYGVAAAAGMRVGGPACSDGDDADSRLYTSPTTFIQEFERNIRALRGKSDFVWTHHNYRDFESSGAVTLASGDTGRSYAQMTTKWVRDYMDWTSWSDTYLFLTEGGARVRDDSPHLSCRHTARVRRNRTSFA
jgi:hypothetical protein